MYASRLTNAITWWLGITFSGMAAPMPEVWSIQSSQSSNQLNGVAYGNGLFVAVGSQATILTSLNGRDWTARSAGTTAPTIWSTAYGNGRYVVGGELGALIRCSTDGVYWPWTNGILTIGIENIHGIAYGYARGKGLFVAVGRGDQINTSYILTSSNGIDWISRNAPTTNTLFGISDCFGVRGGWAEDLFVAVGERGTIITSTNGVDWVVRNSGTTATLRTVLFHRGMMALGDSGTVLASSDGASWSIAAHASFNVRGAASSWDAIVAVGNYFTEGRLHASTDGLTWPGVSTGFPQPLNAIAYGAGSFVAVGDGGLIIQSDTTNEWIKPSSGFWDDPYLWSLDLLPALTQDLIAFRNPGSKTLTINSSTTAYYSNSLSINSLTVSAPPGSFNQLLLSYAGLNVPLNIASDFSLGPNASLTSYSSCLNAGTLLLSGPATFSSQSVASLSSIVVGDIASGELNIADASIRAGDITVGRDASGTINQSGGTNQVQALYMPGVGAHAQGSADYALTGGTLVSGFLVLGGKPFGTFVQSGGVHSNAGNIMLHGQMLYLREPWGTYRLMGGLLLSPRVQVEGGQFIQGSATNQTGELMFDLMASFNLCQGTLVSSNTSIRSNGARNRGQLSSFVQSNGTHTVQNTLLLDGIYRLEAGTLVASNILIWIDGQLQLEGGNVENSGSFSMDNGTCVARGWNYNLGKLLIQSTGTLSRFYDGPRDCTFDLQTGSTVLHFLDSHDLVSDWSGSLYIANWSGSADGGGTDQVFVGTTAQGLTPEQLSRIVFVNPDGLPAASYPARILSTGEIVPGPRPTLNMVGSPGCLVLSWTGNYRLFSATYVTGPYTPVFGASSPYTNSCSGPQGFFQLRSP